MILTVSIYSQIQNLVSFLHFDSFPFSLVSVTGVFLLGFLSGKRVSVTNRRDLIIFNKIVFDIKFF